MNKLFPIAFLFFLFTFSLTLALKPTQKLKTTESIKRIVSLAPSFSDTILALGLVDNLVGVSSSCDQEDFINIKKIGSFQNPNIEAILTMKPDLVLAVPHPLNMGILNELTNLGIEVFSFSPQSLQDIMFINESLAKKLNVEHVGHDINHKIKKQLELLKNEKNKFEKNHVLIAVSANPLVVAGKNTFPSEILSLAGFNNMSNYQNSNWPIWPLENLLARPPDIIINLDGSNTQQQLEKLILQLGLKEKTKILSYHKPLLQYPSVRLIEDIRLLRKILMNKNE